MNKKAVTQLFHDEIARLYKSISLVESLDAKKIYKIKYAIKAHVKDPVTNKDVWAEVESCDFIGKLKAFNKESVRFTVLGMQKVTGTKFVHNLRRTAGVKEFEVSMGYDDLTRIEEWKNLDTPQMEAAFLVNYEFVTQEFKKRCFNL